LEDNLSAAHTQRDQTAEEVERLRARVAELEGHLPGLATDLAKAIAERNHYREYSEALRADLADANAERDALKAAEDDWARAHRYYQLRADLEQAQAERDAMRPVVEKARAWRGLVYVRHASDPQMVALS